MKKIFSLALVLCLMVGFIPEAKGSITYSVLAKLGVNATGFHPNPVVLGSDGNFYGTTANGGANDEGVIFKIAPDGTLTDLHDFGGATDGADPASNLVQTSDGTLYGTTNYGGPTGDGVFFSITTSGTFTILHSFNGANEVSVPTLLYLNTDGNFYGIGAFGGGGTGSGALIKLTPSGTFSIVYSFNGTTDGQYPNSQLVLGSDGAYYGTTPEGGANLDGTYFRVTKAGQFSVIANVVDGDEPILSTLGLNGKLYGYDDDGNSIFNITTGGVRTDVYTFTDGTDGGNPNSLITGADGNLYGLTTSRGANGSGTFFEITSGGAFSILGPQPSNGYLSALIPGPNSTFYATGNYGGTGGAGEVVQLATSGTLSTLYTFISPGTYPYASLLQATDGNLYGTTSAGGTTDDGTIFQVTTTGTYSPLTDLVFNTLGARPLAPLIQDPNTGNIFGTASTGGPDYDPVQNLGGAIFGFALPGANGSGIQKADTTIVTYHVDPLTDETLYFVACLSQFGPLTPLIQISYPNPFNAVPVPKDAAVPATTGTGPTPQLFGVCGRGGDNDEGVFFNFQPNGTVNSTYSFGNQTGDGSGPESALTIDSSNNLYGTTAYGGTADGGTVYKITTSANSTSTLSTIHSFVSSTGITPGDNNLVLGPDGNIYGTTQAGGVYGAGVVFRITPAGVYTVLHSFNPQAGTTGSDGGSPMSGLILASDGNFYGTTMSGGNNGVGTVYSITAHGVVTILHSFTGQLDGFEPYAGVIQGTDGDLYGITTGGGGVVGGSGTIFKIDAGLPPPSVTGAQTITFPTIAKQQYAGSPVTFALNATSSSGLPVTYTYVSGPANLSETNNATVTLTGTGTVVVQANQAGNTSFLAAPSVTRSFTVATPIAFAGIAAATPEGDEVPNLLKYAFDITTGGTMIPTDRAALPALSVDKISNPGTSYLALTYRENALATGISIKFQTSSDLQAWQTITSPDIFQQVGTDTTTGDPIFEMGVQVTGTAKQFIRLQVTQP